jgi:P27 family predicted phage terminase small subunit
VLALVRGARVCTAVPVCPREFLVQTRRVWEAFWGSELAQAVDAATDAHALRRLFSLFDERERAYRAFREKRLVRGSQGQLVLNPLWRHAAVMDSEIRQLEDRFGLTPRARLALGITLGEAQKSLEDMNRRLNEDQDEDGQSPADPRLAIARA